MFLLWLLPVLAVAVALTAHGHPGYAAVLLIGELTMSSLIALATRRPKTPAPPGSGRADLPASDLTAGPHAASAPAMPRLVARPSTATRPWLVAVATLGIFAAIVVIAVLGSRAG